MAPVDTAGKLNKGDREVAKFGIVAQSTAAVLQTTVRWGAAIFLAYYAKEIIVALAGQQTDANIGLKFLGDLTVHSMVGWGVGAGGAIYGLSQRRLRQTTIERNATRMAELERAVDPGRRSSGLTSRGKTNPKDKP